MLDSRLFGKGPLVLAWHPSSRYLAVGGLSRVVFVLDRKGNVIDEIMPPLESPITSLDWDADGQTLAILQGTAPHGVYLWDMASKHLDHLDAGIRDPSFKEPTFIKWSKVGSHIAVGTARGDVLMYDKESRMCWYVASKHKKRITCGDWNSDNKFAFASDDRQITIATVEGKTFGQVKVKSRPTNVKFGGNERDRENVVSVSMDRKTILLYNLDDPENALELAFQQRYGHIVAFRWFQDGYVMVGFSLGFLVVISTHLSEIGREQFCARFFKDALRDLAYCPLRHKVATCGDNCIKIIDMLDWKDKVAEELDRSAGQVDKVTWSHDGNCLSVTTRNGYLYIYGLEPARPDACADVRSVAALPTILSRPLSPASLFATGAALLMLLVVLAARATGLRVSDVVVAFLGELLR